MSNRGDRGEHRWIGAENEDGLSTCATCDGAFHRGHVVLVVGGGDSAMEEATFLTKFADTVYVAYRRDELSTSEIMRQRAFEDDTVEVLWNTELVELHRSHDDGITGVTSSHIQRDTHGRNSTLEMTSNSIPSRTEWGFTDGLGECPGA